MNVSRPPGPERPFGIGDEPIGAVWAVAAAENRDPTAAKAMIEIRDIKHSLNSSQLSKARDADVDTPVRVNAHRGEPLRPVSES